MNNYVGELLTAYYLCLNGNIEYNGDNVDVYKVGVPISENSHYILLRPESENDNSHKSSFVTNPVIVVDIMTVHEGAIDPSIVENIDNQIKELLLPTRATNGLTIGDDFQVLNVKAENSFYQDGFNGARHEYRKIVRYSNRVNQFS